MFGRSRVQRIQGSGDSGLGGFRVWSLQGWAKARLDSSKARQRGKAWGESLGGKLGGKAWEYSGGKARPGGVTTLLKLKYTYDIYV